MKDLEKKYEKSQNEKWAMRFKTLHPDGDNIDGIVTHIKDDFIVLQDQVDFEFDGIIILPKKQIKGVRDGKYEKCCNEIIRQNSELEKVKISDWLVKCEGIRQVLEQLQNQNTWISIERIYNKGKKSDFYIGPIIKVAKKSCRIHCYDATGKWEEIYKIKYKNIFKIEFDSSYCNHFNSYMRSKEVKN